MKPFGCDCSDCPRCNGTVGEQERYILSLESHLRLLIKRSKPFLDSDIVDETSGTIPLMSKLEHAIKLSEEALEDD